MAMRISAINGPTLSASSRTGTPTENRGAAAPDGPGGGAEAIGAIGATMIIEDFRRFRSRLLHVGRERGKDLVPAGASPPPWISPALAGLAAPRSVSVVGLGGQSREAHAS